MSSNCHEKKDIVLITHYYHFAEEKASSRYRTLAEMIDGDDRFCLELITSSFYHRTKQQRELQKCIQQEAFKVTLIHEPGYEKNISIGRLISAKRFAKNVLAYLKTRNKPDLIYQVVPSLDVADAVSRYAKANGIPLMIDIQDLWPEAFRMAVDIPVLSDIGFYPMKRQANRIYARADQVIAVSDTYAARGASVNSDGQAGLSVYIGTDLDYVRQEMARHHIEKPKNEFWVTYIGALGHSYDISLIIKALTMLRTKGMGNIVFQVMGDGVLMDQFKQEALNAGIRAVFYGQVEYGRMMAILMKSDVAVNPIVGKSAASIINKVADYAAAGIPVVNTQSCTEYRHLLENYNAGINCSPGNADEVAGAIERLYFNKDLRQKMHLGEHRLAKAKFSRKDTYPEILERMDYLTRR